MILLNLIDLATTLYITAHGGIELNPIMAYCIDIGIFPYVKFLVGTVFCGWLEWQSRRHWEAMIGLVVLIVYYAFLVGNNLICIFILKGWFL